jgi:hypothetical protein
MKRYYNSVLSFLQIMRMKSTLDGSAKNATKVALLELSRKCVGNADWPTSTETLL